MIEAGWQPARPIDFSTESVNNSPCLWKNLVFEVDTVE